MFINTRSRVFLAFLAWLLPLTVLVPYAFFAKGFRVLIWVVENFYLPFWLLLGISIVTATLSSYLLYRVNRLGLYFFQIGSALILINGALLAMSERRHSLLVILFFLAVLLVFVSETMRRVLNLPFYFSGRHWWESYPKSLPKFEAHVSADEKGSQRTAVRLSNMGMEGCFVFSLTGPLPFTPRHLEIKGPGFAVSCGVQVEVKTRDSLGLGLCFLEAERDGDWQKDLRDQLVMLRRSGYVAT